MIQARYKGNKTRKDMKVKKREKEKEFAIQELEKNYDGLTKEEIDVRKKEEDEAAIMIQARYKGRKTRKVQKKKKRD